MSPHAKALLVVTALGLAACVDPNDPAKVKPPTDDGPEVTAPDLPSVAEPVAEQAPSADEVPLPEDYEEEAANAITRDNYEAKLDALAAEIDG